MASKSRGKDGVTRHCQSAIEGGLNFLSQSQLPNGGFSSLFVVANKGFIPDCLPENMGIEFSAADWKAEADNCSLFPAILIGFSLLHVKYNLLARDLLNGLADFLEGYMKPFGVWQHFTHGHILYEIEPYDVDDTAMASALLQAMGRKVPNNKRVLLRNVNRSGLVYTWLTFRKACIFNPAYLYFLLRELRHPVKSFFFWKVVEAERGDIDAVVNANVLSYLGVRKDTVPIAQYLAKVIESGQESYCDKWYLNVNTVRYFFSRAIRILSPSLDNLAKTIAVRTLESFSANGTVEESSLDTALAVCTLCNLGWQSKVPAKAVDFLLSCQYASGAWEHRIFYYGGPNRRAGWGGRELITALCIEALSYFASIQSPGNRTNDAL
jgi:hypothetical protein